MGRETFIAMEDIVCKIDAVDKASAIAQLVGHVGKTMSLDTVAVTKLLLAREQKKTSGCGKNIAIAHLISPLIPELKVGLASFKTAVPWDSIDSKPVIIAAVVLSPTRHIQDYFPLIVRVCKTLADDSVRTSLTNMTTAAQMITVLNSAKDRYA